MKKRLLAALQLLLGVGIIVAILLRMRATGDLRSLADAFSAAAVNWPWLVAAAGMFGLCLLICTLRWKLLLDEQGCVRPFGRLLQLYLIGHFYNAFILGATGGDVVKAVYAAGETVDRKPEAVATVFVDRLIGLLALIALVGAIMCLRLPYFMQYRETQLAMLFNGLLLIGAAAGLLLIFGRDAWSRRLLAWLTGRFPRVGGIVARVYTACRLCLRHRGILVKTTGLSVLNHLALATASFFHGRALDLQLPLWDYLTIFPIVNMVAAVPITPSGIGTRETAAIFLLGTLNVPSAMAVTLSLLLYATLLGWSLVGGAAYLVFVWRGRKPAAVALREVADTADPLSH